MKWSEVEIKLETTRTRRRFLFFPKCIGTEWRWLEFATWEEKFVEHYRWYAPVSGGGPYKALTREWIALNWIS